MFRLYNRERVSRAHMHKCVLAPVTSFYVVIMPGVLGDDIELPGMSSYYAEKQFDSRVKERMELKAVSVFCLGNKALRVSCSSCITTDMPMQANVLARKLTWDSRARV